MVIRKTINITLYLSLMSSFIGCGSNSDSHRHSRINCNSLKKDISHQQKNVENTQGRYYSSILYRNKKCISTNACIQLAKEQENFFSNKLKSLEADYKSVCVNK